MDVRKQMHALLTQNQQPEFYRSDTKIKQGILRVIYLLMERQLLIPVGDRILNKDVGSLESLSNYELLELLDSIIVRSPLELLDDDLIYAIQNIDYRGKCWYTAQELAKLLLLQTGERHNVKKLGRLLEEGVKSGLYHRMYDKKMLRYYRVQYTAGSS